MSQPLENMASVNTAEPLKNMDDEESQTSPKCFGVSLIVKGIMEHLSNADLFKLSVVNKMWNYEGRSIMKDRGSFSALLKSGCPSQDLMALASLLENMTVVPFSGISIDLNARHVDACELSSTPKLLASIHHEILDRLPWKRLSVTFSGYWPLDTSCSAFRLVINVLEKYGGNLEELSLRFEPFSVYCLNKVIQASKFPRLRSLRYEADDAGHPYFYAAHGSFIHSVVSRAGKGPLRLHLKQYIPHMEAALKGGSVELVADYDFNPVLHIFSNDVIHALRLTKLTLAFHRFGQALSFERFNRIVPVLLRSSSALLTSLHLDLTFAVPLMCYGISLKNLSYLKMDVGFLGADFPQLFTLLKDFDFTRLFPQLETVHVVLYSYSLPRADISQFIEQGNALCREPIMPDRAVNIKHLAISSTTKPEEAPFPLFAQMFPNIEKLTFDTHEKRQAVFGQIWKHWAKLKELEVRAAFGKFIWSKKNSPVQEWKENLDSEFCGIFPQEVAELRDKDDEYLTAVNTVPVMPAITCMRELRTLRILCSENVPHSGEIDPNFIFSKVTCLIAFARCPNLSVVLGTTSMEFEMAVSHIKPYASVLLDDASAKHDLD